MFTGMIVGGLVMFALIYILEKIGDILFPRFSKQRDDYNLFAIIFLCASMIFVGSFFIS